MNEMPEQRAENSPANMGMRKKALAAVLTVFAVGAAGWALHWALVGRFFETTDDAYVDGNVVRITPQVAGTVVAITANDTDYVRAGDELVVLDDADAEVALQERRASLARAVREVRNLFTRSEELTASVAEAETALARARADLRRRRGLADSGAVSTEDVQHANDAVEAAESALQVARERLAGNRVLTDGTTVTTHPRVARAAAGVRAAFLAAQRTHLPAPLSGYVAQRHVQLGQRVSPGTPLMAVVPLDAVWVNANFKESQLEDIRVGQPATLTADANGVEYHGRVVGLGAGTGAAFALLPAQNATGNWVKVVQRLPVRIALDPRELEAHPLAIGLSMEVRVDTHDRRGARPEAADGRDDERTYVFAEQLHAADAMIAEIIAQNIGDGAEPGTRELAARSEPPPPGAAEGRWP